MWHCSSCEDFKTFCIYSCLFNFESLYVQLWIPLGTIVLIYGSWNKQYIIHTIWESLRYYLKNKDSVSLEKIFFKNVPIYFCVELLTPLGSLTQSGVMILTFLSLPSSLFSINTHFGIRLVIFVAGVLEKTISWDKHPIFTV